MSIHYELYENPDRENTGEKQPLHARVIPSGTYTTEEFLDYVAKAQHVPHAQLTSSMGAIISELKTLLSRGYIVEFGELGHLSVTLKTEKPVMDRKEIRSPSICLKDITLKVNKHYKKELNAMMELERISSPTRSKQKLSEEECLARLKQFFQTHPCISRADYSSITGTNKLQAIRQLHSFAERGIIRKYGSGKSVVYIPQ